MRVAKDLFVCGFKVACVVAVCYGLVVVYMAKEADMGFRGGGLDAFEVADVVGVHSEDDVKGEKVVARDGARGVVDDALRRERRYASWNDARPCAGVCNPGRIP